MPPLGLPDVGRAGPTVEVAARAAAVQLFVHQARLVDPGFVLTEDNVADVVALCRRLDGLPLAVQLAAARVRLLPPRALLGHLDEALGLPLPGQPERQRTLMATVEWSYRMVGAPEQRAFRALAVFGGAGGTFEALATVLDVPSSLAVVSGLLDAALVRVDDDPAGTRVRLLQTIRTVAADLAARAGEAEGFRERHAQHYLAIAERAGERLRGPDAIAARGVIEQEMDNLRAALDWSLGDAGSEGTGGEGTGGGEADDEARAATGIRLCTALGWFWYLTGYDAESRRWLERASRAAAARQGPELARLLHSFALLLLQQGDFGSARDVLAKSLLLWRRAGDRTGETEALNSLGVAYRCLGDVDRARALLEESVDVARSLANPQRQATALTNLALLEIDTGHPDNALPLLAEAEDLDLEVGNAWGVAADRLNRSAALLTAGRLTEAVDLLCDLASTVTDHGDPDLTLGLVELLAVAASVSGDHQRAVRLASCADEERTGRDAVGGAGPGLPGPPPHGLPGRAGGGGGGGRGRGARARRGGRARGGRRDRRPLTGVAGPGAGLGAGRHQVLAAGEQGQACSRRATTTSRALKPRIRARYSSAPPTMAPSRFAPKAVVDSPTPLKRTAKIRLATKIGRNAIVTPATNRGTGAEVEQQVARHQPGQGQRGQQRGVEQHRARDAHPPGHLDGRQHAEQHAGEHGGVDRPGGAEEQRELHHVLGLEQQERDPHEEQVGVGRHLLQRAADPAHQHERREQHQRQHPRGRTTGWCGCRGRGTGGRRPTARARRPAGSRWSCSRRSRRRRAATAPPAGAGRASGPSCTQGAVP